MTSVLIAVFLVAPVAGVTILLRAGGGLYWLIPPLWRAWLMAWLFLIRVTS
jgi:hypothetical protein